MSETRRRPKRTVTHVPSSSSIRSDTDTDTELENLCLDEAERECATSAAPIGDAEVQGAKTHSSGEDKLVKLAKRLFFGSLLLCSLLGILALGHLATLGLVLLVQVLMFRELVNVRYINTNVRHVPLFRTTQWGWFGTCMLYSYGASFSDDLANSLLRDGYVKQSLRYVELISLGCYSVMLMTVVLTLKKGFYKYQMGQLAWTIATIVITVVQVNSFTQNILNGLFWFMYPVSLVICNDSMAYFCGLAFGRRFTKRQFIGISPNKTWEGFVGGGLCTVLFAFIFPVFLARLPFLICPCEVLQLGGLFALQCKTPQVFLPENYHLPRLLRHAWGSEFVALLPIQIHGLFLGAFASIVAPFGGLFASGIKRAYKLKDFSSIIPGHGGVFDRVDCQLIMGLATQIYFSTFIASEVLVSPARLLQMVSSLSEEDQVDLYRAIGASLHSRGIKLT
uniref:Phosphatidate cytidylyltransferase n=1 Tax=Calcidiscus leptoporus TaxID=127549 RepID=A0A7S0NMZ8_9EUKA|mmetsp:Transcript_10585/g.24524  ORF Transcript_10585/g.24524 Transcript_10585/m.24524 type:complete len:450 (+) Transcript_10585:15-1364(+)|eukprot:CAMPEP_0119378692 /NCGR_PEP_ID=MMETSP1334-20130426/49393_1 /TAXON_ID=127549 /ORGANISM="Calcidiscus leptoporus, Strain RCC1130" /LENGTH=449 /DNA_ID=CAMNT_0007397975 /DNA_START=15 /DNA_END=1364 /DNA_ORIENTATION=+